MRRLYLRIYLALLFSLVVFALAAGLLWRMMIDAGPWQGYGMLATLAQNALPAAQAPAPAQQAALQALAANMRADVTLFAPDRSRLAFVGEALPAPEAGRTRGGWLRHWNAPPAWALPLADGRWLVARVPREHRHPAFGLFVILFVIAAAVAAGAYPVVRRLTSRLERLQAGVESLGAGDLRARIRVEGTDEVARLARSFNAAAARIEALVQAHRTLLANTSHELRTPLARIRMAIELMRPDADPARHAELERDISELDALIDEILLASRLDAGEGAGSEVQPGEVDMLAEVDFLALAAEECARYPEAELDGQPVTVRGDARLLRRLIRNLLENAHRHGAPPIELRVSRTGQGAEIGVRDHGPGVPEGERERIFEPFYRPAGAAERGGTGLGLSLVRRIARRHGGEAHCEPVAGDGARFVAQIASSASTGAPGATAK